MLILSPLADGVYQMRSKIVNLEKASYEEEFIHGIVLDISDFDSHWLSEELLFRLRKRK
jgi:hypothetical protein